MTHSKKSSRLQTGRLFSMILLLSILTASLPGYGELQKFTASPDLRWWTAGSNLQVRFGENFYDVMDRLDSVKSELNRFLYAIAEMPLSKEQIIQRTGLPEEQASSLISDLSSIKLIRKFDRNRWAATIPIITNDQMKAIKKSLHAMAEKTAAYLKSESLNLRAMYQNRKTSQDPPWEEMTHLFFCKLIVDATFHRNMNILNHHRKKRTTEGITPDGSSLFFFEMGADYTSLGCNWYGFKENGRRRDIYFLHGPVYRRYSYPVEKYRRSKDFSSAYFKISVEGGIGSLTENEKTMFQELGWTDHNKVRVPIVKNTSVKPLLPAFNNIGKKAADIAFGHVDDMIDQYETGPYSKFLEGSKDYIQVNLHILFGIVAERLIDDGVVSEVPDPLPSYFGVYFVFGKLF